MAYWRAFQGLGKVMDEDRLRHFIGRYVRISWDEKDGSPGSMDGWVEKIDDWRGERYLTVDWGMAVRVKDIRAIEEVSEPSWHRLTVKER